MNLSFLDKLKLFQDFTVLGIAAGIVLGAVIISIIIPKKLGGKLGNVISFGRFGIHYSKKYHDERDILGNVLLFFGIAYSFCFGFIPYQIQMITYSALYGFFFLITMGQIHRVYAEKKSGSRFLALFSLSLMFAVNYVAAAGYLNGFALIGPCADCIKDLTSGTMGNILYYLISDNIMCYLLQVFMYLMSFYCIMAQFKYLRLEEQYKADNIVFLWIKNIFVMMIMLGLGYYGYPFVVWTYNATSSLKS